MPQKVELLVGDRVMLIVGAGKAVVIDPTEGETAADRVAAFLK